MVDGILWQEHVRAATACRRKIQRVVPGSLTTHSPGNQFNPKSQKTLLGEKHPFCLKAPTLFNTVTWGTKFPAHEPLETQASQIIASSETFHPYHSNL
jgi:hypothetical protein